MTYKMKARHFSILVFIFIILTDIVIMLNIPYVRQLVCFIFLMILPGLLIIRLMNMDKLGLTEKFILIIGLSIFFVMFFGLLTNYFLLNVGCAKPLSTIPLMVSFNIVYIILLLLNNRVKKPISFSLNLSIRDRALFIVPVLYPVLSILGMFQKNLSGNNSLLKLMFLLILLYIIFIAIYNKKIPDSIYPSLIFLTSFSLILNFAQLSNYIYGSDSHLEFYLFQLVIKNGYWDIFMNSTIDTCLSISLLPAIYKVLLNINGEYIFKYIVYLIPFSLVPLITYIISKKYISSFNSFLASIFLMSQAAFHFQTAAYRTYLAIFFFAMIVMVLFNNNINSFQKRLLFIVFSFACIVSHYSTAFIYFVLLLITFLSIDMLKIILGKKQWESKLTVSSLFLIFVMVFIWYGQISEVTFSSLVVYVSNVIKNLGKLFVFELKDPTVSAALGSTLEGSPFLSYYNFCILWLSIIFIATGVLYCFYLIFKQKTFSIGINNICNIETEYIILSFTCSIIFAISIVLPYVFIGYSLERTYYQMIAILAPFFIIGGLLITNIFKIRFYNLVVLIVLISCFANSIGILPHICGRHSSVILNASETIDNFYYIYDYEAESAKWLKSQANFRSTKIYSDLPGKFRLLSIGFISPGHINQDIRQIEQMHNKKDQLNYIYLRYENVVKEKVYTYDPYTVAWDKVDISSLPINLNEDNNLVYNNGGSKIVFSLVYLK